MISKKKILGIGITDAGKEEVLEYIVKSIHFFEKKYFIVTPNPEFLVLANQNQSFADILNKAEIASADGIGIIIAAKILGKPLKGRFTGVDLVKSLCEEVAEKPITVGFLGGGDGVAERTVECLRKKYPGLKVIFAGEEWVSGSTHPLNGSLVPNGNTSLSYEGKSTSPAVRPCKYDSREPIKSSFRGESRLHFNNLTIEQFNNETIDILFVAFGAPKQEFWINENLDKIPVKVAIGVGGAFDYISGKIPRAPSFISKVGFEWLFRLLIQPWRIKRQLSLIKFAWLVFRERLANSSTAT